ncbi:uncharacterized protein LOC110870352 [Helianthus annuus]|uniref:uncharacterized protein LOC110870352 n=1 Tax=Helianthus annuus TaxID=4232 RepID=UPI000B903195|nr:uncharacterized protein LOC110870352 [Helianthus annuus]
MYKHYQDALAICRVHGNPEYFITFTCNVKWPEIVRYLAQYPSLRAQDRPDIIARVFQIKVVSLINFLKTRKPFGQVAADLYTIEFQKRGLPHCHLLVWVTSANKIRKPDQLDNYISAEIPNRLTEPELYKVVTDLMMHGPCGLAKPNAPCMSSSSCSKHFPKDYEETTMFDKNGYAHYRRRSTGHSIVKNGIRLDNAYVVPYNKHLCLHYQAHINVEYCGWNMMIKYLFKYISKGSDRIRFKITRTISPSSDTENAPTSQVDEIKNFVDSRFICPHEAAWWIFNFFIHVRDPPPPVQVLAVHLENMQNLQFKDTQTLENIVRNPVAKKTTLTEWLRNNQTEPEGPHLTYVDYLSYYRWDSNGKFWIRRTRETTPAIGRLIYIHPSCGETFYLRMLLSHQKGCQSFADIRTVSGQIFPTFRVACERLGLLGDNREWLYTFIEAATWATSSELRSLFTYLLQFCEISNPMEIWDTQWRKMADDITQTHGLLNEEDINQYVLYEIELLLRSEANPSSLKNFSLPSPQENLLSSLANKLLMEEKNYDRLRLSSDHECYRRQLNSQQNAIYQLVIQTLTSNGQVLLFVYSHGGTGKTFLWKTIISALRSQGKIVLAVAASGIASLLLPSGRTAHSRFKIPLNLADHSICHVKKNTHLAQLLKETSLIIWDEAPMNDRKCFESPDRTLKDILNNPNNLFGGKSLLLGWDFRQTLPIKPKAAKSTILASSLPRSYLWPHFKIHKLTENMRLQRPNLHPSYMAEVASFS